MRKGLDAQIIPPPLPISSPPSEAPPLPLSPIPPPAPPLPVENYPIAPPPPKNNEEVVSGDVNNSDDDAMSLSSISSNDEFEVAATKPVPIISPSFSYNVPKGITSKPPPPVDLLPKSVPTPKIVSPNSSSLPMTPPYSSTIKPLMSTPPKRSSVLNLTNAALKNTVPLKSPTYTGLPPASDNRVSYHASDIKPVRHTPTPEPTTHKMHSLKLNNIPARVSSCIDERLNFRFIVDGVVAKVATELKDILKRDICKKLVETMAFKALDDWWDEQSASNVRFI